MIDPVSFLVTILLSVGLSHAAYARDPRNRLFWSCAPGAVLLFAVHPLALMFALVCFAVCITLYLAGRRIDSARLKPRLPYSNPASPVRTGRHRSLFHGPDPLAGKRLLHHPADDDRRGRA